MSLEEIKQTNVMKSVNKHLLRMDNFENANPECEKS